MHASSTAYDALLTQACLVPERGTSLIALTGDDRKDWLQGQATNDVRKLTPETPLDFCLCKPTGQILTIARAWDLPGRLLMAVPTATLEAVLERVERMVIMEDVSAEHLSQYELVCVQGPGSPGAIDRSLPENTLMLPSDRTGAGGFDIWIPKTSSAHPDLPELSGELYEAVKIEAGIPNFGTDVNEKTLPPELGPAFEASHVSYTKGCYTGQEVLARIESRGHTNRTWVGLLSPCPLRPGLQVSSQSRPDAGTITSSAFSPRFGHIAAALVRHEALEEGSLTVESDSDRVEVEVRPMPLSARPAG